MTDLPSDPSEYPVLDVLGSVRKSLAAEPLTLLKAPPGAGKSTLLPLHLLHEPWLDGLKIVMLEPRRLAAKSVATRLAELLGESAGQTVGYRIRMESAETASTKLLVVTEGILIRMLQHDPGLEGTGLVIFDEFHERSLQADVSLMMALQARELFRPDLRLLLMSATLEDEKLSLRLGAPVITSTGRLHPVEFRHEPYDQGQPLARQVTGLVFRALRETKGDVLVFLPGTGEIRRTADLLQERGCEAVVQELYGDLPFSRQQAALKPDPSGRRKVVLSTAIAETSLTIQGITTVIDSGFSRIPRFDPQTGLTRLVTVPVTLDAATQRAGRAGRLGPGTCYRLWEQRKTAMLQSSRKPEVLEADLAPTLLELYNWGIRDPYAAGWIDAPPSGHISQAIELLELLGAINAGIITGAGKKMADLPVHPRLAHMMLAAGNTPERKALACDIAALLEERDPLRTDHADIDLRLAALAAHRAGKRNDGDRVVLDRIDKLSRYWRTFIGAPSAGPTKFDECGMLLSAAFPDRLARQLERSGNRYQMATGVVLQVPSDDPLIHSSLLAVAGAGGSAGQARIFLAAAVEVSSLERMGEERSELSWDEESGQFKHWKRTWFGKLLLSSKPAGPPDRAELASAILELVRDRGLEWAGMDEAARGFQSRVCCLHRWRSEEGWPDYSDPRLLETLDEWLTPWIDGIAGRSALQRLDWTMMLQSALDHDLQRRVDVLVPEKIAVPSGSMIRIMYHADGSLPELHVRLQEVFGWLDTPTVNGGSTPMMMHLLSPAFRPVQITRDLRS
ncbi:MAG: ATP-dependent helicase HrpB, partial [Bacteroidota bacterium]